MIALGAPSEGQLAKLFSSTSSTGFARGNTSGILAQKLKVSQDSAGRAGVLPVCRVQNASSPVIPATKQGASSINAIARGVRTILACPLGQPIEAGDSFESLYLLTERVVSSGQESAEALFDRVKLEMERAIGEAASSLRAGSSIASLEGSLSWLRRLQETWQSWGDKCNTIKSILTLLDQAFLLEQSSLPSVWQVSLDLFTHTIIQDNALQAQFTAAVKTCVQGERKQGNAGYQRLHLELVAMLETLGVSSQMLTAVNQATMEYFTHSSEEGIKALDTAAYLDFAEKSLAEEQKRSAWLFSTEQQRTESIVGVHHILITTYISNLIRGLDQLLEQGATKPLAQLYHLLSKVDGLKQLQDAFGSLMIDKGAAIVQDKEKDDVMIERLLEYKAAMDKIVEVAFNNDTDFKQAQKQSFETFINKRENKPAELIAKFLDARLRSGNKTMTDAELEHVLNEALVLFRYTHAKDMFEEFYKRLFAKRLLLNRSASSDAEQSMLLKLKDECGPAFTQKLETMLTDISLSDEMMKGYASVQAKAASEGKGDDFELSVNVLTQAHWPSYPQVDLIIPVEMARATERFQDFYESRNQGRKLQWTHSLGTTSLTANLSKAGEKELLVSTFQTVVLLLFNAVPSGAKLSYNQIKEQVGLEEKELKRTLQSLACGQIPTRILRKEPQGKDVSESDEFFVNEGIKNERKRIRINMIQLNETQEEQKSTVDRVMFDRELILQASAVRILKARKTIKHAELLQEIVKSIASRFTVDVAEIKKTFEILIDKEYMERVEGQRGVYRYLA